MAEDVAALGFEVDSAPLAAATQALGGMAAASAGAEAGAKAVGQASTLAATQTARLAESSRLAAQAQQSMAVVMQGLQSQMIAMAGGLGLVGVALASFGPVGLAAAVGLKAVSDAIKFVVDESNRMGDKAIAFRQFSDATGLTAREVSGLRHAAAEFGVSGDTMVTSIERLTFQMNEARQATGPLFEGIREVDKGLSDQLVNSETTAQGIDALAQAWRAAGNEAQKAAIARAAFGRGGAGAGPVLGAIADAGGIDAMSKSTKVLTESTDDQTRAWAKMRAETVELRKQADNILASIITEDGLRLQHDAAQAARDLAQAFKDIVSQREGLSAVQRLFVQMAESSPNAPSNLGQINAEFAARQRLQQGLGNEKTAQGMAADPKAIESWGQLADAMNGVKTPAEEAEASLKKLQDQAQAASNAEKERIGFLGAAATAAEKATATNLELTAAFLKNKMSAEDYARAIDASNHAAAALTAVHEAAIQTLHARTAAEREAAAAATVLASDASGDAQLRAQQAVTMEIEKQKQAHADAMAAGQDQLNVASAVGGAARMAAEEQAKFNELIREGRTEEQAAAEAALQRETAQAQVNSGAQEQLASLQDQAAAAGAISVEDKAAAQAQATMNSLIRQGVDATLASKIAAQEYANAIAQADAEFTKALALAQAVTGAQKIAAQEALGLWREAAVASAEATSNVQRQTIALQQQNELTAAGQRGGGGVGGLINQQSVAAQQAYNNAINEGATKEAALGLATQTRYKYQLQINEAIAKEQEARQAAAAAEQEQLNKDIDRQNHTGESVRDTGEGAKSVAASLSQMLQQLNDLGDHALDYFRQLAIGPMSIQQAIVMATTLIARLQQAKDISLIEQATPNQDPVKKAHDDAIRAGASETAARKIADLARADAAKQKADQAAQDAKQAAEEAAQKDKQFRDQIQSLKDAAAMAEAKSHGALAAAQLASEQAYANAMKDGASAAQAMEIASLTLANAAREISSGFEDQIQSLKDEAAMRAAQAQGGDAAAQLQAQQAYTKAVRDGATQAQAQEIATLTLAQALSQNTSATQNNTAATIGLSGLYQGAGTFIGFRPENTTAGPNPNLGVIGEPSASATAAQTTTLTSLDQSTSALLDWIALSTQATASSAQATNALTDWLSNQPPAPSTIGQPNILPPYQPDPRWTLPPGPWGGGQPNILPPDQPSGHWVGGGPGPITWVGEGPPDYNQLKMLQRESMFGLAASITNPVPQSAEQEASAQQAMGRAFLPGITQPNISDEQAQQIYDTYLASRNSQVPTGFDPSMFAGITSSGGSSPAAPTINAPVTVNISMASGDAAGARATAAQVQQAVARGIASALKH